MNVFACAFKRAGKIDMQSNSGDNTASQQLIIILTTLAKSRLYTAYRMAKKTKKMDGDHLF